ncbi:VOC family protein [Solibacillus sp. FSL K6-4121]|uniref:VOC family protein n=1 Tax=Solibacillus sp. FSL K6-4121 TaxID=2921505 RepID=UPI0030F529D9
MKFKKVSLQTNDLEVMKDFYKNNLGCTLDNEHVDSFEVTFGYTTIEFNNRNVKGNPFYHFAFDIPSNQFLEAKEWAIKRVTLSTEDGEDDVYFENIKAHSLYFEDPAGNILEFISRTKDNPTSETPFSIDNIIQMSEMSLVVEDKVNVAEELKKAGIIERNGDKINHTGLNFMSDKNGAVFLLLVSPNRRWYFSQKDAVIFPMTITLENDVKLGIDDNAQFFLI